MYTSTTSPKLRKSFDLTPSEAEAIKALARAGYAFPPDSLADVSVIRQSLRDAWKSKFPDKPFPGDE